MRNAERTTSLWAAASVWLRCLLIAVFPLAASIGSPPIAVAGSGDAALSAHGYDLTSVQWTWQSPLAVAPSSSGLPVGEGPGAHEASEQHPDFAAEGVGNGSGPWVDDALTAARPGGATAQSAGGSCVSACGQMLSGGARTQAQLLDELGEWSTPETLAGALGPGWRGGSFGSAVDAVAAANRGPMGAVLRVPGSQGHMVVTSPMGAGRYQVRDPWGGGSTYEVGTSWIERYVAGGTFR